MKRTTQWILGAAIASLLVAGVAQAGARYNTEVYIGTSSAVGSIGAARNSTDTRQYIYCSVRAFASGGGTNTVVCGAEDRTGRFLGCSSTQPQMVETVRAMTESSWVKFNVVGGECSEIQLYNDSRDPPKAH